MQKASSHPAHSKPAPLSGEKSLFKEDASSCSRLGIRMGWAPTHCMQSVAGTISLP